MNAQAFLHGAAPNLRKFEWMPGVAKLTFGVLLVWRITTLVSNPLWQGWIGMVGLVLLLHFGGFDLVAVFWRARGIKADAIMRQPLRSTSLSEFWNVRWNRGFNQLAHEFISGARIVRPESPARWSQPLLPPVLFMISSFRCPHEADTPARPSTF